MSEEDKKSLPDDLFRDGLNQFQPEPSEDVWDRLQDNLHQEGRYHEADDLFHEVLSDYAPEPPSSVWNRLHKNLETPAEFTWANHLSGYDPQPPHWVWQSLQYMLRKQRHHKTYARIAVAFLFLGCLSALFLGQNQPERKPLTTIKVSPGAAATHGDMIPRGIGTFSRIPQKSAAFKPQLSSLLTPISPAHEGSPSHPLVPADMDLISGSLKDRAIHPTIVEEINPGLLVPPTYFRCKTRKENTWYLHINAGTDVISGHIASAQGHEDYLSIRRKSESAIATIGFYTGLEYRKGPVSISAGIRYSERGEDAVYNFKTYVQTSTDIQFYNQSSRTYFSVPYPYTLTYDHRKATRNRLIFVEMPISAGWRLNMGKCALTPFAGVRAGWLVHTGGTLLTPVNDPTKLTLNDAGMESFSRLVWSADCGIRASYTVTPKMAVTAGVLYNQTLQNVFESNSGITQEYKTYSFSGGLSWKL